MRPRVPPERDRVALDDLEQALEDRLLRLVPGSATVGVAPAEAVACRQAVADVAVGRRQEAGLVARDRPGLGPSHGLRGVEGLRYPEPSVLGVGVALLALTPLRLGEEQQVVRMNGSVGDVDVRRLDGLASLDRMRAIALDSLAERACSRLSVGWTLAPGDGSQRRLELAERRRCQSGYGAGSVEMERSVDVESLQRADHACDRAHESREAPQRLLGLTDALTRGTDRCAQRPERDARRGAAEKRGVAAGRTLWAVGKGVLGEGERGKVQCQQATAEGGAHAGQLLRHFSGDQARRDALRRGGPSLRGNGRHGRLL